MSNRSSVASREEQRRQQADQRRREEEYRQQQALEAQRAEAARQAAHAQAFVRQWTADVDRYGHFGADAMNQAMTNTINAYFPPPAGFMHDYQVVWHGRNPDGTLEFGFLPHQLVLTPDEISRRQANQQMWQNIALTTTIAVAGGRVAGSIDRNTHAINNANQPNYIGPMGPYWSSLTRAHLPPKGSTTCPIPFVATRSLPRENKHRHPPPDTAAGAAVATASPAACDPQRLHPGPQEGHELADRQHCLPDGHQQDRLLGHERQLYRLLPARRWNPAVQDLSLGAHQVGVQGPGEPGNRQDSSGITSPGGKQGSWAGGLDQPPESRMSR